MSPFDSVSIPASMDSMSSGVVLPSFEGYRELDRVESEASSKDDHKGNQETPQSPAAKSALWQGTPLPPGWVWSPLGTVLRFLPEAAVTTQPMRPAQMSLLSIPMPEPGSSGTPYFEGKGVTETIKRFEKMAKQKGITDTTLLGE
ncbi:hypothetical protein N7495_003426 [Penicillium taxi]|uniref:uncharacterized protein n=1 Tax=Penicillium taxi TaxID=168475 RepID=UPI002544EC6A|nr:uncharacterized protein N7495_003426 [Penicillium taxi]KAJ5902898.1 hypothetical protein N7495_003426 [Penicillium taxi]